MVDVIVHKGRTEVLPISLDYDVSNSVVTSQIREGKNVASTLIADWMVTFKTDGKDGELILTLDDSVTATITQFSGYMDLKRIVGGEPVPITDNPIQVIFKEVITE